MLPSLSLFAIAISILSNPALHPVNGLPASSLQSLQTRGGAITKCIGCAKGSGGSSTAGSPAAAHHPAAASGGGAAAAHRAGPARHNSWESSSHGSATSIDDHGPSTSSTRTSSGHIPSASESGTPHKGKGLDALHSNLSPVHLPAQKHPGKSFASSAAAVSPPRNRPLRIGGSRDGGDGSGSKHSASTSKVSTASGKKGKEVVVKKASSSSSSSSSTPVPKGKGKGKGKGAAGGGTSGSKH